MRPGIDRAAFGIPINAESIKPNHGLMESLRRGSRRTSSTTKEKSEMLKGRLNAAIVAAILLACTAIVPAFAHGSSPNSPVAQQDKMKDDKMAGSNKMSSKRHKHRRHRKHKMGRKMDKMQGNMKM